MTSCVSALAGVESAPSRMSWTAAFTTSALLTEMLARIGYIRARCIGIGCDRYDLAVILLRLVRIAGFFGSLCGTDVGMKPVRLLLQGSLECSKRFRWLAAIKQHYTVELAGGHRHARRYRMLLGLVFGVSRGTHCTECFVVLTLGIELPGRRNLLLDIDLLGPVRVFRLAQLLAQLDELGDVRLRSFGIAGASGAESAGEVGHRLHLGQRAGTNLERSSGLPVAALDRIPRGRNSKRIGANEECLREASHARHFINQSLGL